MKYLLASLVLGAVAAAGAAGAAPCEHGELIANPADCTTFYQCSFGNLFLLKCPPGLAYDAALERCEFPAVGAGEGLCDGAGANPHQRRPAPRDVVCPPPSDDDLTVQLPNPDDCSSFYKCDAEGTPILNECPPGLEYNAELQVCDFPGDAGCSSAR